MSLILSQRYDSSIVTNLAIGLSQLLRIAAGVLFLWSADLYRRTKFVPFARWRWAMGVAAWFVLSPMLLGPSTVVSPGFLLSAALLGGA